MNTTFCVFQRPKKELGTAVSLAWCCQTCAVNASTRFDWTDDLYFVWGYTQSLKAGTNFFTVQSVPVRDAASVQLACRDDVFSFQPVEGASTTDELMIHTDGTVPNDTFVVGLGMMAECMCGTAALAVRAGPNNIYTFERETEYCLAAIPTRRVKVGDVLDLNALNAVHVPLGKGRNQLTAVLGKDNRLSFAAPAMRLPQ